MLMMVETRELSKAFGDHVVLEGIDLPHLFEESNEDRKKSSDTQKGRRCMKPAMVGNEFTQAFKKAPGLSGVPFPGKSRTLFALLESLSTSKTTMVKRLTLKSSRKGGAS